MLDDILDISKTALLIVDMQNDFCKQDGVLGLAGKDLSMVAKIIATLNNFIQNVRNAGAMIVFIKQTCLPKGRSHSPVQEYFRNKINNTADYSIDGTWGHEIISDLVVNDDDILIKKYRASAFVGTPLDLILKSNGISTLILTGVWTNGCIESTARDAQQHDYFCVVAEDCVASTDKKLHQNSIYVMKLRYDVLKSHNILKKLYA